MATYMHSMYACALPTDPTAVRVVGAALLFLALHLLAPIRMIAMKEWVFKGPLHPSSCYSRKVVHA